VHSTSAAESPTTRLPKAMNRIASVDAEIVYTVVGGGPPVVLLHPFPVHHEFWTSVISRLSNRYRLIVPDLRGHGDSGVGEGPATMSKHAEDVKRICDQEEVGRAAFVGVSIGGYILFEFWRRYRERVATLGLCNTRATAETEQSRAARLQSAGEVLERGIEPFAESMLPKVLGKSTLETRPDLLQSARSMILKMSPMDINLVQKGMAERPDSVSTLKTINVPVLVVAGEEDAAIPAGEAEIIRQNIAGAQLRVIPKAGHYATFEQPEASGLLLRQFLDNAHRA
jgi:3-oxoadipate enol-lactonase